MNRYEELAEELLSAMDKHRHLPPEPISATVRGEMAVMRLLSMEGGGMSAGAIAQELKMTTSRIAAVLNSLEKKNMITRSLDAQDRRRVLVELTETGKTTCLARREKAKQHLACMLMRLSEEDAGIYVRLAEQLFGFNGEFPREEV